VRRRLFFITDVHGSDRCFRKFLNAAPFYGADVIILGGDVTGKVFTPVVEQVDGSYRCTFQGDQLVLGSEKKMEEFRKRAADSGTYTSVVTPSEFSELEANPAKVSEVFMKLMVGKMREWMALAEERLGKTQVRCFVSPGNDDRFEIDGVLDSSKYVVNPEGRVVDIDGNHEMITLGYTNHTPWKSPREVGEDELARKISAMADKVKSMKTAIFNIHVPPIDTPIDQAPKIDENLKQVISAGHVEIISAGSSACRRAITRYQPMLGLHGHIHESRGVVKLGRTLCANPGSEYGEGILRGFLADVEGDRVRSYLLTSG
jgi:Icc-related predicted phosphoesterase